MTKVDPNKVIRKDPPMRYPDGDVGNAIVAVIIIAVLLFMFLK
jgi:hypothetical protein